jgi:predicted kinase
VAAPRLILVEGMIGSGKTTTAGHLADWLSRRGEIAAAIARVHQVRGEPWSSRNVAYVQDCPWARRRNLRGRAAVVQLYQAWEPVATRLYDRYPFPKLMVPDPHHDWPSALRAICAAIRR